MLGMRFEFGRTRQLMGLFHCMRKPKLMALGLEHQSHVYRLRVLGVDLKGRPHYVYDGFHHADGIPDSEPQCNNFYIFVFAPRTPERTLSVPLPFDDSLNRDPEEDSAMGDASEAAFITDHEGEAAYL